MHTERQWYAEDARQIMEAIRHSAEERCEHAQQLCEEAAMIQERARELQHMSQRARHRRKKQRARSGFSRASVVEGSQRYPPWMQKGNDSMGSTTGSHGLKGASTILK